MTNNNEKPDASEQFIPTSVKMKTQSIRTDTTVKGECIPVEELEGLLEQFRTHATDPTATNGWKAGCHCCADELEQHIEEYTND